MQVTKTGNGEYAVKLTKHEIQIIESVAFWHDEVPSYALRRIAEYGIMQVGISALTRFKENN